MGYSPSTLKNLGHFLFGFNEVTTTSLGDIVLLVQASPVTLNIQFSVVDDLSPYNEIHSLTYHQMVSYLMEEGQVDLLGSQLVACQCYQVALDFGHPASKEVSSESSNTMEQ